MTETQLEFTVLIPDTLRELIGGESQLTVSVEAPGENQGAPVSKILDAVASRCPLLGRRLRDETGALRRHVNMYVDGDEVRRLEGLNTQVLNRGELMIMQSVAGG